MSAAATMADLRQGQTVTRCSAWQWLSRAWARSVGARSAVAQPAAVVGECAVCVGRGSKCRGTCGRAASKSEMSGLTCGDGRHWPR
jgi:hypothetical protein